MVVVGSTISWSSGWRAQLGFSPTVSYIALDPRVGKNTRQEMVTGSPALEIVLDLDTVIKKSVPAVKYFIVPVFQLLSFKNHVFQEIKLSFLHSSSSGGFSGTVKSSTRTLLQAILKYVESLFTVHTFTLVAGMFVIVGRCAAGSPSLSSVQPDIVTL